MATRIRVECINKTDRYDPDERIRYIGGRNHDGTRWKLEQQDAIQGIQRGDYSFLRRATGGRRSRGRRGA